MVVLHLISCRYKTLDSRKLKNKPVFRIYWSNRITVVLLLVPGNRWCFYTFNEYCREGQSHYWLTYICYKRNHIPMIRELREWIEITDAENKPTNIRTLCGDCFVMRRINPILAAYLAENNYVYIRK